MMGARPQTAMSSLNRTSGSIPSLLKKALRMLQAFFSLLVRAFVAKKPAVPTLEEYEYTPLDSKSANLRLLKLQRRKRQEIECELVHQSLSNDDLPSYDALSYAWGSTELVETIIVDGKQFWITENLHSALQSLRSDDQDRYLWVDAICINQNDTEEKSQQVQQMGDIYSHAERTLVWLGKATLEILSFMDALEQFRKIRAFRIPGQWPFDNSLWSTHRTGLLQMLNRPWFTRAWILQEVANARKVIICCGDRSIPADILARAPSLIEVVPSRNCQAALEIMPGRFQSKPQDQDLYDLLQRFHSFKATDDRDKIYALLSMSTDPLDKQNIMIDYSKPTAEVVQEAMAYVFQSTQARPSPIPINEFLGIMGSFPTVNTNCFLPEYMEDDATEVGSAHLESEDMLTRLISDVQSRFPVRQIWEDPVPATPWQLVERRIEAVSIDYEMEDPKTSRADSVLDSDEVVYLLSYSVMLMHGIDGTATHSG